MGVHHLLKNLVKPCRMTSGLDPFKKDSSSARRAVANQSDSTAADRECPLEGR